METTAIQSANAVTATTVALANIRPNSFNPRRQFDDVALGELADSIRQQGVLQAIGLRPLQETDSYEIIYGERRYRASLLADKMDIPATIYNVSEEEAEEMAIAENLQRTDITPMEEANAYQRLLASGRHDVQSLSVQFGKSEAYIRTRLKFSALIPEIAALLDADEITVSVATEICRYSEDIQREVYDTHFENDNYSSWRGLKASEVARNIERDYTTNLRNYKFDKSACANCPHNTCNLLLFVEDGDEGKCANRSCLAEKNCAHLLASALSLISQYPTAEITQCRYSGTEAVTERLNEMGYEIADTYYQPTPLPTEPVAPIEADYDTPEEFAEEMARYEIERGYNEVYEKRHKRLAERIAEITATTANETEATTEPEPTAEAAEVETSQPEATNPDKEEAA